MSAAEKVWVQCKDIFKLAGVGFGVILLVNILFGTLRTIDSGEVGLKIRFGKIHDTHLDAGLHVKIPIIESIQKIDIRLKQIPEDLHASSKDIQYIMASMTLQYELVGSQVPKMIKKIGNRDEVQKTIIEPAIHEGTKAVIATYTAEELIQNRETVKNKIKEEIKKFINSSLEGPGLSGVIKVNNIAIQNLDFSPSFAQAIENKVKAEQQYLQAINNKEKIITNARAQAEQVKIEANATAMQIELVATARADVITKQAASLNNNPLVLELKKVEKWHGNLPVYSGTSDIPLVGG